MTMQRPGMCSWGVVALVVASACNTDPVDTLAGSSETSTGAGSDTGVATSSGSGDDTSGSTGSIPDDCGNDRLDPGELCDAEHFVHADTDCVSLGYLGGDLGCASDCSYDVDGCTPPGCGNGILEPGEACDGDEIEETMTCGNLGFLWAQGSVACAADCTIDTSGCTQCGSVPTPPGGVCPPECNGGCDEHTCFIDCTGGNCYDADYPPIQCPADFDCAVHCEDASGGACAGRDIVCPWDYRCSVTCAASGCVFSNIICKNGPCDVHCDAVETSCLGGLECGTNSCHATCEGASMLAQGCGLSCDCVPCEAEPG